MREIKKKSIIPIYLIAAVAVIYSIIFPLYRLSHFIILAVLCAAAYFIGVKLIPGTVEYEEIPEEPVNTGDAKLDALLEEGRTAVKEMKRLKESIGTPSVTAKIDELIVLTEKIFEDAVNDPDDIPQIERFAAYYLPTTIKLLNAYDRMGNTGIDGENISGTMTRIEEILDTTILAYNKQFDALFLNQALDIDTDITVLEGMLKREGLAGKDF